MRLTVKRDLGCPSTRWDHPLPRPLIFSTIQILLLSVCANDTSTTVVCFFRDANRARRRPFSIAAWTIFVKTKNYRFYIGLHTNSTHTTGTRPFTRRKRLLRWPRPCIAKSRLWPSNFARFDRPFRLSKISVYVLDIKWFLKGLRRSGWKRSSSVRRISLAGPRPNIRLQHDERDRRT